MSHFAQTPVGGEFIITLRLASARPIPIGRCAVRNVASASCRRSTPRSASCHCRGILSSPDPSTSFEDRRPHHRDAASRVRIALAFCCPEAETFAAVEAVAVAFAGVSSSRVRRASEVSDFAQTLDWHLDRAHTASHGHPVGPGLARPSSVMNSRRFHRWKFMDYPPARARSQDTLVEGAGQQADRFASFRPGGRGQHSHSGPLCLPKLCSRRLPSPAGAAPLSAGGEGCNGNGPPV